MDFLLQGHLRPQFLDMILAESVILAHHNILTSDITAPMPCSKQLACSCYTSFFSVKKCLPENT